MLSLDDNEMNMLDHIIKATRRIGTDKIMVRDIKQLFDLRTRKRTHKTTSIIMKIISSAVAFVITMLVIYVIYRITKCITKSASNKRTNMTLQLASMSEIEDKARRLDKANEHDQLIFVKNSPIEEAAINPLAGTTIIQKSDI